VDDLTFNELLFRVSHNDQAACTDLFESIRFKAVCVAKRCLSRLMQRRKSPDAVVNWSFHECILKVRAGKVFEDRDEFQRYLHLVIKRRCADLARAAHAERRDIRRDVQAFAVDSDGSVDVQASDLAELSERRARVVRQIIATQSNEIERMICLLGVLCQFRPLTIRDSLAGFYDNAESSGRSKKINPPGCRWIQIILAKCRKELIEHFSDEQ